MVDKNYNFEQSYFDIFQTFRVTSDTTKVFSQDGTNPIVSINNYEYPLQARHNQLIKTTTKDSYGSTLSNTIKYAIDFEMGMIAPTNIEAQGIQALQQKGIITAVIESISRTKQSINSTDEFITGASYQTFYKADSIGVKAGMPKSSFVLENVPRFSMTEANYNPNTSVFTRSNDYDLKSTVSAYTSIGLPVQVETRFGTISKINYNAIYPTLPSSQITNLGQASEQTTSMTYAKILYGISKQVGVNNLEVNSEYYADGKLKQQTDKDGKVLKHIQYVYRGQADSDPLLSTDINYNRIITRIPRIAATAPLTLTHLDCVITIVYMDGMGRVVENLGYRASPNEKDMVSGVTEYDKFNRPKKQWLSVESNQNTGALLDTTIAKSTARTFYKDQKPYSEVLEYEASPISRIFKSYGVGKVWQDSGKYVQMEYQTATGTKRLFVNNGDDYMVIGTYSGYELSKSISTDERGSKVIEYKDKSGNVVQRDVQVDNTTNYLTTLFCFDPAGRLRFIFPPKSVIALGTLTSLNVESWSGFNENVYSMHYDGRNRVYESHKPGIGWEKTVFNRLNQAVLSQDDNELAKNNTWNYVQTDGQNRTVKSGQANFPESYDRTFLQQTFDNFTVNKQFEQRLPLGTSGEVLGYDNNSFPNLLRSYVTPQSLKNVSYYDNYSWIYSNPNSGPASAYAFQSNPYNATAYSNTNATGLSTGGLYKIDNFGNLWFPFTAYSDDKNRSIQSITYQDLYARNQSDIQYNFVGESLQSRMIYRKSGASDNVITTEKTLDHAGRTKDIYYNLVEGTVQKVPRFRMSSMLYDNIGRIKTKFIQPADNLKASKSSGDWTTSTIWQNNTTPTTNSYVVISKGDTVTIPASTTVTAATLYDAGMLRFLGNAQLQMSTLGNSGKPALQSIDYSYNVRGKMRGVNLDINGNPQTSGDKLFSYRLDYHEDGRYFDGSISKQTWKSSIDNQVRTYRFSYDRANRLTSAISGVGEDNFSIPRVSYDVNGNITFLSRMAKIPFSGSFLTTKIDSLNYQYLNGGNKLKSVTDNAIRSSLGGFKNGTNSGDDYDYYLDGKLRKDLNRNVSLIEYNYLDLVSKIKFVNNDSIQYFYSSTGDKRRTERTLGGQRSYTLYDGEMIYTFTGNPTSINDFKISEIQNSEGRYVNGKLEYGYTDHLGNLRLSYKDSLGKAFVTQGYAYDAWGLELKLHRYQFSSINNDRYTWQGKEDLEADNLEGWSDFGWRIEDKTLGRWFTPDPEDQFVSLSSYALCGNNPVMMVDPNGREFFTVLSLLWTGYNLIKGYADDKRAGASTGQAIGNALFGIGVSYLTAGIGDGIGNGVVGSVFRGASNNLKSIASKVISGGISGGLGSGINGGNFLEGVGRGAATSLAFEGAERGFKGIQKVARTARDKNIPYGGMLDEITVRVSKNSQQGKEVYGNWVAEQRERNRFSPYNSDGFGLSVSGGASGIFGSASFDAGFAFGNDGFGVYGGVTIGAGVQAPGVGLGVNANFFDKYGLQENFFEGLRGDGVGYDGNAVLGGGYSRSAVRDSNWGYVPAKSGTQTTSFGIRPSIGNWGARRTYSNTTFLWHTGQ